MKEHLMQSGLITFDQALVEAGHFYGDSPLAGRDITGILIGKQTVRALSEMGLRVTPAILVDNFHESSSATEDNLLKIADLGFNPEVVYRECDFEEDANGIFLTLQRLGKVKELRNKGTHNLKHPNMPQLMTVADRNPSCALLDAAIYQRKHNDFGGICITVLPEYDSKGDYRRQQENTKAILKAAGIYVPILNVYFTDTGEISVDFDY